jgi:mevalonate kinase
MEGVGNACGKVILLGEHAVVYGVPALAVGIDRGAQARAVPTRHGPCRLLVRGWNIAVHEDRLDHDLARAFRALLECARAHSPSLEPQDVEVEASLPPGGGLGCSAAIGVAIARALCPLAGHDIIQAQAMAWEQVFHGNPSGVDAAVAARGGCLLFRRGEAARAIRVRGPLQFCVGNTGRASSTRAMVEGLARLRERETDRVNRSFEAVRELVEAARLALEAGDRIALGGLMDQNQTLLEGLFLSTSEIGTMCDQARRAGALGAKLTGAGGGGCVVALVPSAAVADAVLEAWKREGLDGFAASAAPESQARTFESEAAP